jgi:acyl phosphate:glycerol-3-phosphate acyltransferase
MTPENLNANWWIPLAAYFIGSIPFGYLITRYAGRGDIRRAGSGNVGATNVARSVGIAAGAVTFLLDAGKGVFAVWLAARLAGDSITWMLAAAIGAVFGHVYPVWLAGKGGRGVSTAAGSFLLICWPAVAAAMGIWIVVLAVTRFVSLASIAAAAALPLLTYLLYAPGHAPSHVVSVGTSLLSLIVILRHKENVGRLISGTEARLGSRRERAQR